MCTNTFIHSIFIKSCACVYGDHASHVPSSECLFLTFLQAPHHFKNEGATDMLLQSSTISDVSDPLFYFFSSQLFCFQDLKMFGVVLNACDRGKQWEVALSLLTQMHISSIRPGQIACNSVAAWSKYGQVTRATKSAGWRNHQGNPNQTHYIIERGQNKFFQMKSGKWKRLMGKRGFHGMWFGKIEPIYVEHSQISARPLSR